jgi:hypothetical protein
MQERPPHLGTPARLDIVEPVAGYAGLANVLWQEREALELLLFRLTTQQLILGAGDLRWIAAADADVASALEQLREFEVLRAIEVQSLTAALGVPDETSLRALADDAPEPWGLLLTEHREALGQLTAEITAAAEQSRQLVRAGADAVRETLALVTGAAAGYGASGAPAELPDGPVLLDRRA